MFFLLIIRDPFCQVITKTTQYNGNSLGGGFKYFLFSPLFGENSHFDEHIFEMGWFNHQLGK